MKAFRELIYSPESASGEAAGKVESHTPKIDSPETVKADEVFEVRVSVGPHPNLVEHSIRKIEVYFYEEGRAFNPVKLAEFDFTPVYSEPDVRLKLKLKKSGAIYALGYCNLHGVWEGRREIKVT